MKNILTAFAVIIVVALAGWYARTHVLDKDTHFHSGFVVYINGKLQDYSKARYMSLVPCSDSNGKVQTHDKLHLHDGVGDVVHVHQPHVVWNDLFSYLHLSLHPHKTIKAYINGKQVSNIGQVEIQPYDSLLLLIDTQGDSNSYLKTAPTKEYIHNAETRSGLCKG